MNKKNRSKKRDFSLKDIKPIKLNPNVKTFPHNAIETMSDKAFVAKALIQCLQDGDAEAFKEILRGHLDAINKAKFAAKTQIPERTLYRMTTPSGNPTLENIAKVVHALCA